MVFAKVVRSKAVARAAVIGLALGVFALAVLAAVSITTNARTTSHIEHNSRISDHWSQIDLHIGVESEALNNYIVAKKFGRDLLDSAMGSASPELEWQAANGDPLDVENAVLVTEAYSAFTQTLNDVRRSPTDRARSQILADQAALGASMVRKSANANVTRHRLAMDAYLAEAAQFNQKLSLAATVVCGADFLLLVLCAAILLTHQRRIEGQAVESRYRALHDELTGLANRALLADEIEDALWVAEQERETVGLLLLDLNKFKEVNDTLGHHAGDLLLKEVAARLTGAVRGTDTVARLGGDEFAVLMPHIYSPEHCAEIARRLLEALEGAAELDGVTVDISGSIGAAVYPVHSGSGAELLQHADIAMYTAKRNRLGIAVYDPEADRRDSQELSLIGELRRAIDEDELVLHYQPKVATSNGRVRGVEALIRWEHPVRGLLQPGDFIPQAEESEVIVPLTDRVLKMALEQHRMWRDSGTVLPVAVNVPTVCLLDAAFPDRVAAALSACDVAAGMLTLEITETSIITDPVRASAVLTRLRETGVRLSVDDFGTGYSSMSYLQSMPLHELKIDRSFVRTVTDSHGGAAIVRAVLELARALDLEVVAEGVEDEATLILLGDMGCTNAQGYHISRPVRAADLITWLGQPALEPA
ncbi:EAL domain-containing protein [Actinoplanes sp. NEAU-A12]|uniref:EAL domain-containing protein n=1 Tax=Actinoplanes sandaracinus TaxID=3045177 RepID=A0ABT6WEJ7_9ACTN|nr:EAL domain-containing protein [Actinoplanes sandaracinus]MDI6098159.1 EAL domain-containing protein [Actinoplanes sandaracinus]